MAIWRHRDTVTRSWGPYSCHSSDAITSCFSMIMHNPMLQGSVYNSWNLKMSQFFHGLHIHQTCHPLSMVEMLWIDVYDSLFQFYPANSHSHWRGVGQHSTGHNQQLYANEICCCMRQMVFTQDTAWFSDPHPYLFFKVLVINRCISLFPVMWNP
jgi:hypothetical protein